MGIICLTISMRFVRGVWIPGLVSKAENRPLVLCCILTVAQSKLKVAYAWKIWQRLMLHNTHILLLYDFAPPNGYFCSMYQFTKNTNYKFTMLHVFSLFAIISENLLLRDPRYFFTLNYR